MPRTARTNQYQQKFGERLQMLMITYLEVTPQDLAARLGLASTSSLRKAISGKGGLDIERLQLLSQLKTKNGDTPNLDWLLTGRGTPLLSPQSPLGENWHAWLSPERKHALRVLIDSPVPKD